MAKEVTLENLAAQMAEGFAKQGKQIDDLTKSVDKHGKQIDTQGKQIDTQGKQIQDLTESVALVVKHMATKDDIARLDGHFVKVHTQLSSIEAELKSINRRIGALEDSVGNLVGFAKEVVELRSRLEIIERHLGLDKKVPA